MDLTLSFIKVFDSLKPNYQVKATALPIEILTTIVVLSIFFFVGESFLYMSKIH